MCLLNYVFNCEQHLPGFIISIRIICNRIGEGLLHISVYSSARRASTANDVCMKDDVFRAKTVSSTHMNSGILFIVKILTVPDVRVHT
jgi:hypothetical protein